MIIPFPRSDINRTILDRFLKVAEVVANNPAVVTKERSITYDGLRVLSAAIAADLREKPPTEIITILCDGGIELFAAIFASLRLGSAFVTIPIRSTVEDQKRIWERCGKPVVLTTREFLERARTFCPDTSIHVIDPDTTITPIKPFKSKEPDLSIANLMFTSGSTGQPKGVISSHRMMLHTAMVNQDLYRFTTNDHVAMFSSFGFGAALTASFAVLLSGATLYIPSYASISELIDWIRSERISILSQMPGALYLQLFAELIASGQSLPCRGLLTGGSQNYSDDIRAFRKTFPNADFFDHRFAGSEFMLLYHTMITPKTTLPASNELIPFSTAAPDKIIKLIDEDGNAVAKGESGEIVITSEFISSGYWMDEELTAKHFSGPDEAGRFTYRSGDIGRYDKYGNFEFLGRADRRVKFRGFTVHLDAISNTLKKHPQVKDAFAILQTTERSQRLMAYYQSDAPLNSADLRVRLLDELPTYMVPAHFTHVDEFPRTQTGKIISADLPKSVCIRPNLDHEVVFPTNALEAEVVRVFEEVLEIQELAYRMIFLS